MEDLKIDTTDKELDKLIVSMKKGRQKLKDWATADE